MNQPSILLKHTNISSPTQAITSIWNRYTAIFTQQPQQPETYQAKYPLVIDCKEVLVEVPSENKGHHPKENRPGWGRGNQPKQQFGLKLHQPNKSIEAPTNLKLFQTSGLCEDINSKSWYYTDDQKQTQGPFTSKEMDALFMKQVINMQTRVALESLEKFVRIEKIIKVVVNTQKPAEEPEQQQPPKQQQQPRVKDPFKTSGLTEDFNVKIWYYKKGTELQGPFDTKQMDLLWSKEFLTVEDRIAFESTSKFVKMEKIIKLADDALKQQQQPQQQQPSTETQPQQQQSQPQPVFEIDLDYSKIPQKKDLGAWGDSAPQKRVPVQANVISQTGRSQGQIKQRGGAQQKSKDLNKSLQVEGQHGNLYEKEIVAKQLQKQQFRINLTKYIRIEETTHEVKVKQSSPVKQVEPVEDEWMEVGTGQKKKNTNSKQQAYNQGIPGLVASNVKQQQQQKSKGPQQVVGYSAPKSEQEQQVLEDDGWIEVNPKQNKTNKK